MSKWHRVRFMTTAVDDPRPVKFPPPGPFWVTGQGGWDDKEYATIVAYFPDGREGELHDFWPEAETDDWDGYDHQLRDQIEFTDRFKKPDWWSDDHVPG
jgi:hypothetical protein